MNENYVLNQYREKCIVLYGTGEIGNKFLEILENEKITINFFCDSNPLKWGGEINGIEILSPTKLKALYAIEKDNLLIIISSFAYEKEILRSLAANHFFCIIQPYYVADAVLNGYLKKNNKKRLKEFKNQHYGERCFVIGNGPSLIASDLDLIKNEFTFAANKIYDIYDSTEWRPTYHCCFHEDLDQNTKMNLKLNSSQCESMFISGINQYQNQYFNSENMVFIHVNFNKDSTGNTSLFSEDLLNNGIGGLYTVTYSMLELAVYMGFKEIYLLGIDFDYPLNEIAHHFIESDAKEGIRTGDIVYEGYPDLVRRDFIHALNFAESKNIKIKNATRGGKLEVFQRIGLEDVLEIKGETKNA